MFFHVHVGFSAENVAFVVFELFLDVGPKLGVLTFPGKFFMERQGVTNRGNISEMNSIGDLEAPHSISMPPFLEVHFESPAAPVRIITANLAFVLYPESMQFVQPVWNRLPVPAQRQVLRVVNWSLSLLF